MTIARRRILTVCLLLLLLLPPRIAEAGDACDVASVGAWSVWTGPPTDTCFEIDRSDIAIWKDRKISLGLYFGRRPPKGLAPSRLYFSETKDFKFDEIARTAMLYVSGALVGSTRKGAGESHELMEAGGRSAVFSALRRGTPVRIVIEFRDGSNADIDLDARDFERAYQTMLGKRKRP